MYSGTHDYQDFDTPRPDVDKLSQREREREREREGESQNGPFSFVRSGSVARAALTEGPGFESSHQRFY